MFGSFDDLSNEITFFGNKSPQRYLLIKFNLISSERRNGCVCLCYSWVEHVERRIVFFFKSIYCAIFDWIKITLSGWFVCSPAEASKDCINQLSIDFSFVRHDDNFWFDKSSISGYGNHDDDPVSRHEPNRRTMVLAMSSLSYLSSLEILLSLYFFPSISVSITIRLSVSYFIRFIINSISFLLSLTTFRSIIDKARCDIILNEN